jgi:UDP-N-acetylmuramate dehydrogenase
MTPATATARAAAAAASNPNLLNGIDAEIHTNAPIGQSTWFKTGGCADVVARPRSSAALCDIARRCAETNTPLRILGSGANLLVLEEGVDGVVVDLSAPAFTGASWDDDHAEAIVRIGAGADLFRLVQESKRLGRSGLAQMAGIPATLGGAVRMNAGGAFGDIAQSLVRIEVVTRGGEERSVEAADLRLGYRHCELPEGCIVVAAHLRLPHGDPLTIEREVHEIFEYKKRTQPMGAKSAGCMFRNPTDRATSRRESAGKLIDQAGLKGLRVGSAFVSECHGNFLAVERGGRARDVLELSRQVQQRVLAHSGWRLEREVVVWSRQQVPSFPEECG